jgi:hypothetical protein
LQRERLGLIDDTAAAGPSRRPAAEAISKYSLVDIYAKASRA